MNNSIRYKIRLLLVLSLLVFVFVGCQSTPSDEPQASEQTSVSVQYSVNTSDYAKLADSLTWSTPTGSGAGLHPRAGALTDGRQSYSVQLVLPAPLGNDALTLSLWKLGVRVGTLSYTAEGTGSSLSLSGVNVFDTTAMALLQVLAAKKDSLPQTRDGLVRVFGEWLISGDSRAEAFPDSIPVGLVKSEIVLAALVAASKLAVPLATQAKNWQLGVSIDSARVLVLELIHSGKIDKNDSATLFPPAPMRVGAAVGLASGLKAGGEAVAISGSFEWNSDVGQVTLQYSVRHAGGVVASVLASALPTPSVADRSVTLAGATLVALGSAAEGDYLLVLTAKGSNGDSAVSSVTFRVTPKDPEQPLAPKLRLSSPTDNAVVPFETSEVATTWIATSSRGRVDSVVVDGIRAQKRNDTTWMGLVKLDPTGKSRTIVARAYDSAKLTVTETVTLTRQPDLAGPDIVWVAPQPDMEYENGVTAISVRVKVSDPSGVDTILIAGQKPDSLNSAGEWVRKVPLSVVGSPMSIEVRSVEWCQECQCCQTRRDKTESAHRCRLPKWCWSIHPPSRAWPCRSRQNPLRVRWIITDAYGIDSSSVTVNGTKARSEPDNKWSALVDLVEGSPTSILLAVKNKNGVSGGDAIYITRIPDTTKPVISLVLGSRKVGNDSAEVAVSCTVEDNDSVASVTIGGREATREGDLFVAKVKIYQGDTKIEVVARDRSLNLTSSDVVLHRYPKLSIVRANNSGDTVVPHSTTSLVLWWNVWGGVKVVGASLNQGAYTTVANLEPGANVFKVIATDSAGKLDSLETTITRRNQVALSLSYGKDTLTTLPDSVVIAATSETGANLAWSMDGKTWISFTASFVQKTTGTALVRAQVVGKDEKIASLKAFTLYHTNHAPVIALANSAFTTKSYLGAFQTQAANVTSWGVGDGTQTGTYEAQLFNITDSQYLSNLSVTPSGVFSATAGIDTSVVVKVRFRLTDNGGTTLGGVNQSAWSDWLAINIVDTVLDHQSNSYRARRMPDGKVWMRSNMVAIDTSVVRESYCADGGCGRFGRNYSWEQAFGEAATKSVALRTHPAKGICPVGWHMSARSEWSSLFKATIPVGQKDSLFALRRDSTFKVDSKGHLFYHLGGGKFGDFVLPNGDYTYIGPEFFLHLPIESGSTNTVANFGFMFMEKNPNANPTAGVRCVLND